MKHKNHKDDITIDGLIKKIDKRAQNFTYEKGLNNGVKMYDKLKKNIETASNMINDHLAKIKTSDEQVSETEPITDEEFEKFYNEIEISVKKLSEIKDIDNKIKMYLHLKELIMKCQNYVSHMKLEVEEIK